jgi:uncharacterized alpha/beta hydrolase family protein
MNKRSMALVVTVAVCMLLAVVSNAMAADANQPKVKSNDSNSLVIGIVTVVKGNDGNIAEIKVTAHRELVYKVVLDAKGIELGKTMADKRVRIEGTIEKKGDVQWLTVKTFSDLKPRADVKPKPKPPQ